MQVSLRWLGDVAFEGVSASGHKVRLDGAPEYGGQDSGMRPMEMLLIAMGGCTAFDVVSILRKARQSVQNCVLDINATRAETIPKVFTKIHVHFILTGHQLDPQQVARAISLSAEKYCSASLMLSKACEISHDFEIVTISEATH